MLPAVSPRLARVLGVGPGESVTPGAVTLPWWRGLAVSSPSSSSGPCRSAHSEGTGACSSHVSSICVCVLGSLLQGSTAFSFLTATGPRGDVGLSVHGKMQQQTGLTRASPALSGRRAGCAVWVGPRSAVPSNQGDSLHL